MGLEQQLSGEQQFVKESFAMGCENLIADDIVLYGIGKNTEAVLTLNSIFHFIGLMDETSKEEALFGHPLLSYDEVIALHPKVVIIARESVVSIIYRRIEFLNTEHGISIYNFKGELLGKEQMEYQNDSLEYWNSSEEELKNKIRRRRIISFDIFDTLVTRKVLEPTDVFDLVEKKLQRDYNLDIPFKEMRIFSEKSLDGIPTYQAIYQRLQKEYQLEQSTIDIIKQLEFQTEKEVIIPKTKMIELYFFALSLGKTVYLISDMYYSKIQIQELLELCGIDEFKEILISGDIGFEKSSGELYDYYINLVGANGLLHIGDNRRNDVAIAKEKGLEVYHVYNGYELLMASSLGGILSNISCFEERMILGLLISKFFNNPFSLCKSKGRMGVSESEMLGYFFIAPLITGFIVWLLKKLKEKEIKQILLPARDGYLIKQVYNLFAEQDEIKFPEPIYFKTSRRSVTVAAIEKKEDITHILKRRFQGTYGELLEKRFGINPKIQDSNKNTVINYTKVSDLTEYVLEYEDEIYINAQRERKNYLSYLAGCHIVNNKKQGLFDFVAGGTVQFYLSRLLKKDLHGFYFATMNVPNDMLKDKEVDTAYGNIKSYGALNNLGKYYLILETILVDCDLTFIKVDENEKMLFEEGENLFIHDIILIQKGILEYAKEWVMWKKKYDLKEDCLEFNDKIFGLLFSKNCVVSQDIKKIFKNDDQYDGVGLFEAWVD